MLHSLVFWDNLYTWFLHINNHCVSNSMAVSKCQSLMAVAWVNCYIPLYCETELCREKMLALIKTCDNHIVEFCVKMKHLNFLYMGSGKCPKSGLGQTSNFIYQFIPFTCHRYSDVHVLCTCHICINHSEAF